jgi:hypothetical protein
VANPAISNGTYDLQRALHFQPKQKYHLAREVLFFTFERGRMIRHLAIPLLALLPALSSSMPASPFFGPAGPAPQQKQDSNQPKSRPPKGGASLTGCVDEQDGQYVLVDDRTLSPIANLEADGFPTENFAKHLGHKVTVRGTSNSGGARPVFKVRTIEPVSDTCAPSSTFR